MAAFGRPTVISDLEIVRAFVAQMGDVATGQSEAGCSINVGENTINLAPDRFAALLLALERMTAGAGQSTGVTGAAGTDPGMASHTATAELTPNQAAAMLGMSRPTVVRLIERGLLPARMVGAHHRMLRKDVEAYRDRNAVSRRDALSNIAGITGEYDF